MTLRSHDSALQFAHRAPQTKGLIMSSPTSIPEVPPPHAPEPPALSEPARLMNVFVAPRKLFIDLRRHASWCVPWLLIALIQVGYSYKFSQKIGWETMIEKSWEK